MGTLGGSPTAGFFVVKAAHITKNGGGEVKPIIPHPVFTEEYKYVNVGEGSENFRSWEDCVRYGFLSAGQGRLFQNAIKSLKVGHKVYAYISGQGYVCLGEVIEQAVPVRDFNVGKKRLLDIDLRSTGVACSVNDPERTDWAVRVKWLKTFPREEARYYPGIFANPNAVFRSRDPETLKYLHVEFGN